MKKLNKHKMKHNEKPPPVTLVIVTFPLYGQGLGRCFRLSHDFFWLMEGT